MEKKETTILCTSNLPDSNGTSIPTTSDGMRDSDELCECRCFPELTDEELAAIDLKEIDPYVGKYYVGKYTKSFYKANTEPYHGEGVSPMAPPTGLIWALRAKQRELEPSEECLEAARQALERQEKMKDVSNEEWIEGLAKDRGKFRD